jgi:cytochrome bd-type quinol oxidase subunit 2
MSHTTIAGLVVIAVPLAFNGAFALLAARFDYPDILRLPTSEVLARFRAGGTSLVLIWWSFALSALLMVPLVVLLSSAIDDADSTLLALATSVGVLAALVQFLGLVRWPFLVPYLARSDADPDASPARREAVDASSSPSTATSASPSASTSGTCSPARGPRSPDARSCRRAPFRASSASWES